MAPDAVAAPAGGATQAAAGADLEPVDWELAARVASRIASRGPDEVAYQRASLGRDFGELTVRAEELVAGFTGLRPSGPARARVVGRGEWARANVTSMRQLVQPLSQKMRERMAHQPMASVTRRVAGAEIGILLGYFARRVLGQYDLLVPDGPDGPDPPGAASTTDAVYFVGPNVLALEKRFAFRPRDFRMWIALHELTHRAQFTAVPWMRPYFLSLVEQSLLAVDPDPGRITDALRRGVGEVRAGRNPLDDGGLVTLFATPEQRAHLARVQALMSLLEGHGNLVMNHLGREHVAGQARMAAVLEARRHAGGLAGWLQKALGLELKLRQYELGESFCVAVERDAGLDTLAVVWRGPEWLPTLEELADHRGWLERVDGGGPGA